MRNDDAEATLGHLLTALPYVTRSARVAADELSAVLAIPPDSLRQLLGILEFCGLPPYGGGDTFDCVVEGQRISVWAPVPTFQRPVRLSTRERAALAIGINVVKQVGAYQPPVLKKACEKLRACFSAAARGEDEPGSRVAPIETFAEQSRYLSCITAAMEKRLRLEMDYYSYNSDRCTKRVVEPVRLECVKGRWYLLARCLLRRGVLHFRLERIRSIKPLEQRVPRRLVVRERKADYQPDTANHVHLLVAPEVAGDWQERERAFLVSVEPTKEKETEVVIATSSAPWLARLVLRYAGKVRVVAPDEMRRAVAQAAAAARQPYVAKEAE